MRSSLALVLPFVLYAGCGSSSSSPNDAGNTGTGGSSPTGTGGNSTGTGGTSSTGTGGSSTGTGGSLPGMAGNPNGSCTAGVPTSGQPADVSNPT